MTTFMKRQIKDSFNLMKKLKENKLEEIVTRITKKNRHGEMDWGDAVGNEVW